MPKVSVIVPTYNSERFIAEALESVAAQTLGDFEVVVVDDGSVDHTVRIAHQFANRLRMQVVEQPNAGPSSARNTGIRVAGGEYCAFLDSDDLMLPHRLEWQAQALDSDPTLGLVHSDLETFNERGTVHKSRLAFSNPCGGYVLEKLLLDNFITTSTVMARKASLVDAGLFDTRRRLSEDFELWLKICERAPIAYIDRPVTRYRSRSGSLSDDKLRTGLAALSVVMDFWSIHPEYRAANTRLFRRSMAAHMAGIGAAATSQGQVRTALAHLLGSLRYRFDDVETWKWLAKAILVPVRRGNYSS